MVKLHSAVLVFVAGISCGALGYIIGTGIGDGEASYAAESGGAEQGGAEIPVRIELEPNPQERQATEIVSQEESRLLFPIAERDFIRYTSPFGHRMSPVLHVEMVHQGLDISAVWRAEVVAVADGIVSGHWPVPGTPYPGGGEYHGHDVLGGLIEIDHGDGVVSRYGHLSYSRVAQGQRVRAGDVLGRIGSTGRSTGEHLHFELWIDGAAVNPLVYVDDPRKGVENE